MFPTNFSKNSPAFFIESLDCTAIASMLLSPSNKKPCIISWSSTNSHFFPNEQELQKNQCIILDVHLSQSLLEYIICKATRLLIWTIISTSHHQSWTADIFIHLIQIFLGSLHCRADERLNIHTSKNLSIGWESGCNIAAPPSANHTHGLHSLARQVRQEPLHPEVPDCVPVSDGGEPGIFISWILNLWILKFKTSRSWSCAKLKFG